MRPLEPASIGPAPASAITGLDLIALVLLLHVWAVVAGVAAYTVDGRTGLEWADRRIDLSARLYAALMFLATVVTWIPFAVGHYPFSEASPLGPTRGALWLAACGGILIGAGFYFLGGLLTALRSSFARRLTAGSDGDEHRSARAVLETVVGCAVAAVVLIGAGSGLLWWLAGHGLP